MTVVTGQAGGDETPDVVETLVNELVDVRGQLSAALGDLYEQGEDLVKARNQVAYRDRKITELTADLDRARDVAVALEQEIATIGPMGSVFGEEDDEDEPPLSEKLVEVGRQELAERTAARGTVGDPGRYTSFLEAHEYGNPAVREATEELAREIVQNEWARRGLALGGLLTGWAPLPLAGRPPGWTFTVWGTPAADVERTDG